MAQRSLKVLVNGATYDPRVPPIFQYELTRPVLDQVSVRMASVVEWAATQRMKVTLDTATVAVERWLPLP